jgi:hypothetical protein
MCPNPHERPEREFTMGLRTPDQYKASLRDGRAVFFRGEKVPDVTAHPVIGIAVNHLDVRVPDRVQPVLFGKSGGLGVLSSRSIVPTKT